MLIDFMKSNLSQGIVFLTEVKHFKGSTLCVFLLNFVSRNNDSNGQPESKIFLKKLTGNLNNF